MLRDGGTYVEMGQFTDAGAIADQLAPDLHQGPERARLLGVHRERSAAGRGDARPGARRAIRSTTCRRCSRSARRGSARRSPRRSRCAPSSRRSSLESRLLDLIDTPPERARPRPMPKVLHGHALLILRFALVGVVNSAIDVGLFGYLYYAQALAAVVGQQRRLCRGIDQQFPLQPLLDLQQNAGGAVA